MDHSLDDTLPRFETKAAFRLWEEEQESRFEFDGKDVTEVNGGTVNHLLVVRNLSTFLHVALRGGPFMVLPQIKVETVSGYRYPDVSVGRRGIDGETTTLPAPVILFEVLSPSTAHVDLGRKRAEYAQVGSVKQYVLVESSRMAARVLARAADRGWIEAELAAGGKLDLPEVGVTLPLTELYEDVRF